MSRGTVRKRTWKRNGRKRTSWGWTLGKEQTRRQGFASREEAQADLDAYRAKRAAAPILRLLSTSPRLASDDQKAV